MKKGLVLLVAALMASVGIAGTIATPHVVGAMNGWNIGAPDAMVETAPGSDIWELSYTLDANARYEFKLADGPGDWGTAITIPGANSWLYTDDDGNITITYDGNTYADGWSPNIDRIALSTDGGAGSGWTVAGNFQGWDNANPATAMTHIGGGVYTFSTVMAPGNYEGKAVITGSLTWDSISWDGRSVGTSNNAFTTDAVNDTVVFTVDSYAGVSKVEVIPEPSSIALLVAGSMAAVFIRRMRK